MRRWLVAQVLAQWYLAEKRQYCASARDRQREDHDLGGLTLRTFEEAVGGRAVLVQVTLLDAACEECNATWAKWDELIEAFRGSEEVLVGRVACDAGPESEELCAALLDEEDFGTDPEVYPTVRYGSRFALGTWWGSKSAEALIRHAEVARAPCSALRRDRCSAATLAQIDELTRLGDADLEELTATAAVGVRDELARIRYDVERRRDQVLSRLDAYRVLAEHDVFRLEDTISFARAVAKHKFGASPPSVLSDDHQYIGRVRDAAYSDDHLLLDLYDDGPHDYYDQDAYHQPSRYELYDYDRPPQHADPVVDDYSYDDFEEDDDYYYDEYHDLRLSPSSSSSSSHAS